MLHLHKASKSYDNNHWVFKNVDLELKTGEFLYLIGGTGAGKTTLLKILAMEEPLSEGALNLFGVDDPKLSGSRNRTLKKSIGYIPQHSDLIPELTVREVLDFSCSLSHGIFRKKAPLFSTAELVEKLSLKKIIDQRVDNLSGGETQRVLIAQALIRSPQLILADEPTGSQDPNELWQIMELFVRANQMGVALLLATHDREIVRRIRRKNAILKDGSLQLQNHFDSGWLNIR